MPFIPHTEAEVTQMLATIGVDRIDALFDEIPPHLHDSSLDGLDAGLSEWEMLAELRTLAAQDDNVLCFAGAGCYAHHIPAAVWDIIGRGEFMTAYTPYQAEASQGTLQLLYEYQSMMATLMAMEVSNASLYDGASALAEAILMALRANRSASARRVWVAGTIHPLYLRAARDIVRNQQIELDLLPLDASGVVDLKALPAASDDHAALVIPQPNYLGRLEAVDQLTDWAHANGLLAIALVNPLAMALLKPPGQWGSRGADIAVGDGQPLGIPMASGGPSFGFVCCREALVRQLPGRLIGRTLDRDGRVGFTLVLQAREQHIRREKATSNICTNQGLLVAAATLYLSLMGPGLARIAARCHDNCRTLAERLRAIPGVELPLDGPCFHELVVRLPRDPRQTLARLADERIFGGVPLADDFAQWSDCMLVCTTETSSAADIDRYLAALERALG